MFNKKTMKKLYGGSAASDRVVRFANSGAASLEDYKHKANLPGIDDVKSMPVLYQTAGASKKKRSLKKKRTLKKKSGPKKKRSLKKKSASKKKRSLKKKSGFKKKTASKKKRSLKKKTMKSRRGRSGRRGQRGGGFLGVAGCGPVNYPDAGRKYSHLFTKSSSCPGPDFYRNPPGLEKAGSGNGAVAGPGAPFPFK